MIREVPGAAAAAAARCTAHDYRDPGKPKIAWDDEQARAALASALVNDALGRLGSLPAQPEGPAADPIGLLALVAGQDVELAEGSDGTDGRWRVARRTAPDRVVSVTDPDARHIHKNRTRHQDGSKAHVAFEPETGLLTAVELTGGSGPGSHDAAVAVRLLAGEKAAVTVLGDAAYGTGERRAHLRDAGHAAVIKPPPLQPAVPGGFTGDDFTVDEQVGTAACPAGHTVPLSRPHSGGTRLPSSRPCAAAARCASAAPPPRQGGSSASTRSTPCWPPPAAPPPTLPGKTSTAGGGPRSNGPSPGSLPAAAAESPTAASPATTPGSPTGPPPSTSAG